METVEVAVENRRGFEKKCIFNVLAFNLRSFFTTYASLLKYSYVIKTWVLFFISSRFISSAFN